MGTSYPGESMNLLPQRLIKVGKDVLDTGTILCQGRREGCDALLVSLTTVHV